MALFGHAYNHVYMLVPTLALNGAFAPAYAIVKVNEGGYVNDPVDKGGETYAGIARKIFPNWQGWSIIDAKKYRYANGIIPVNEKFPDLDFLVTRFYQELWDKYRYGEISSQIIANLMFDFAVHSGPGNANKAIQRIVGVNDDGVMGSGTLAAINKANEQATYSALLAARKAFLEKVITNNDGYEKFRAGFAKRLAQFEQFITTPGGIGTGVIAVLSIASMVALYFWYQSENKPKRLKAA